MAEDQTTSAPDSPAKRGAQFRNAGIVILVFGLISAGLVYWLMPRPETLPDEFTAANKKAAASMQVNFGRMGMFASSLNNDLKDPVILTGIIVVASILLASG